MWPSNWELFSGPEKLLICCHGCCRSGRLSEGWVFSGAVKLLSSVKMFYGGGGGRLQNVVSVSVSLCAEECQEGFHPGAVAMHVFTLRYRLL